MLIDKISAITTRSTNCANMHRAIPNRSDNASSTVLVLPYAIMQKRNVALWIQRYSTYGADLCHTVQYLLYLAG
jgi:hypothetical protein